MSSSTELINEVLQTRSRVGKTCSECRHNCNKCTFNGNCSKVIENAENRTIIACCAEHEFNCSECEFLQLCPTMHAWITRLLT